MNGHAYHVEWDASGWDGTEWAGTTWDDNCWGHSTWPQDVNAEASWVEGQQVAWKGADWWHSGGTNTWSVSPAKEAQARPGPAGWSSQGNEQQTARVHFAKTYRTLSEVLETHTGAFKDVKTFLDLGCAPGGFSSRLLEENPEAQGFGVTLPWEAGGFPMIFADPRLTVQSSDLMKLESPDDLECPCEVDACIADAQDLSRRVNPDAKQDKGKGKGRGSGRTDASASDAGVQAACAVLGIWAMTLQELLLGLGRLTAGGTFFFRFGWRGRGTREEYWYLEATHLMLALILAHFTEVAPFKSEHWHQAHPTFYVFASGFDREAYVAAGLTESLREAIKDVVSCPRATKLPECLGALVPYLTEDTRSRVVEMLDRVGKIRSIGLSNRKHLETARPTKEAALWISPVPFSLTMPRLQDRLERYGKIVNIKRRAHPIGVGADALVQFAQPAHAEAALKAIVEQKALGEHIVAKMLAEKG